MKQISLTLQTLYQDVLQAHLDHPPSAFDGTPHIRKTGGKSYWYATVRSPGGTHQQKFIGPDNELTRKRIDAWQTNAQTDKSFRANCAEKTAALRAARLPALDMQTGKTLRALAQAGTFRLGGVLVGTHAFRLYDLELGLHLTSAQTAITADIDIAAFERLSLSIEDQTSPDLPKVLTNLNLAPVPSLNKSKSVRWRLPGSDFVVDFITPSFKENQGPQKLGAFGLWAQGLHYLNFLIRDPIPAVAIYREGVLVQIPSPERYAIHKLIISTKRKGPGRAKAQKDLAQAKLLIEALREQRPSELNAAYKEAIKEGPNWKEAIQTALKRDTQIEKMLKA